MSDEVKGVVLVMKHSNKLGRRTFSQFSIADYKVKSTDEKTVKKQNNLDVRRGTSF